MLITRKNNKNSPHILYVIQLNIIKWLSIYLSIYIMNLKKERYNSRKICFFVHVGKGTDLKKIICQCITN